MLTKKYNGMIPLKHFENLQPFDDIIHFVTTRLGGLSSGVYASFNLGYTAGDSKSIVDKNRQLLAGALGIKSEQLITIRQSHTKQVQIVTEETAAATPESDPYDAQVTNVPGKCLTVIVADCVPILLYDPTRHVIAAVHAGWRGTVRKIVSETMKVMSETFGCNPRHILAGIGPSIGPCCYEIGQEVIDEVVGRLGSRESFLIEGEKLGKARFDLWEANRRQLVEAGVLPDHIEISRICTSCNTDKFYSYRKEKDGTGRMMAGIMLK